jgi:hypothetical protein
MAGLKCDFCDAPDPQWSYDASPIVIDFGVGPMHRDDGRWAACTACADLIDANDRDGLLVRAYQAWRKQGMPQSAALDVLRGMFTAFFMSKQSDRKPLP